MTKIRHVITEYVWPLLWLAVGLALFAVALGYSAAPASANVCVPINVQGGGWGGTSQTCLPNGDKLVCDNGFAPFVGRIENCFVASPGHPRY